MSDEFEEYLEAGFSNSNGAQSKNESEIKKAEEIEIKADNEKDRSSSSSSRSPSREKKQKKKRKHRSRSRSKSRDRRRRSKSRSRRRSRSRDRRRRSRSRERDRRRDRRSRSRSRDRRRRSKSRSRDRKRRSRSRERDRRRDRRSRSRERGRRESPQAEPKSDAYREDCSVLVLRLHPKVEEKELLAMFEQCGEIRDARVIRDPRTKRSKGCAYVEFVEPESVLQAITMTGAILQGASIIVQASQAEKNRQAIAAKQAKQQEDALDSSVVLVSNIHPNINEDGLKVLFETIGPIESVSLLKESGVSQGIAYVKFALPEDATSAIQSCNGLLVGDQPIQLILANDTSVPDSLDDEEAVRINLSGSQRLELMKKLQRGVMSSVAPNITQFQSHTPIGPVAPAAPQVSTCLRLRNMFNPATVDLDEDPEFYEDLKEDVVEETSKYGQLQHIAIAQEEGLVYVRYNDLSCAAAATQALNGRFFAGNQIIVEYVSFSEYQAKFPSSG